MADTVNANWNRWIFASLTSYFAARRQGIPFYIEGQSRPDTVSNFGEFRLDGPLYNELNNHYWTVDVTVTIIISIVQDDQDIHKLDRIIGIFLAAFTTDIPVFRYGDNPNIDTQEQLGCLKLSPAFGERIRVDKFGQIKVATPITQASIEAHYVMTLIT